MMLKLANKACLKIIHRSFPLNFWMHLNLVLSANSKKLYAHSEKKAADPLHANPFTIKSNEEGLEV